jgi:adenine-specific DNA-methyltransferase
MKNHRTEKEKTLGQFFTKEYIIEKLLDILFEYKPCRKDIKILEPSFGTRNFITVLNRRGLNDIDGCEIDVALTKEPKNFFDYSIENKYDIIIGNPPFTKYNIKQSYYYLSNHETSSCHSEEYLPKQLLKKEKEKIENIFILKSLKHLKDKNSTIAFILPISFFIKNKNKIIKRELLSAFSTIIIYQNKEVWFNYNIPCCFAIFSNISNLKNKIVLYFENEHKHREILNIDSIFKEIIPEVFYNKKYGLTNNHNGNLLKNYLSSERIKYLKSFKTNNISAKNILENNKIPPHEHVEDYKLAVVRVGNASVGKSGLINIKKDVLNDMFFVFDFNREYTKNKDIKEKTCGLINGNPEYFQNVTCRVGSKSIKKEDIYNFKVDLY